jgi:AbrB family looped-hinge helix DNA binding protein
MRTSTLTTKGQITIPADLRRTLGLSAGDLVGFVLEDGAVRLVRRESRIEAAFGLLKSEVSVSDAEMQEAIRERAGK